MDRKEGLSLTTEDAGRGAVVRAMPGLLLGTLEDYQPGDAILRMVCGIKDGFIMVIIPDDDLRHRLLSSDMEVQHLKVLTINGIHAPVHILYAAEPATVTDQLLSFIPDIACPVYGVVGQTDAMLDVNHGPVRDALLALHAHRAFSSAYWMDPLAATGPFSYAGGLAAHVQDVQARLIGAWPGTIGHLGRGLGCVVITLCRHLWRPPVQADDAAWPPVRLPSFRLNHLGRSLEATMALVPEECVFGASVEGLSPEDAMRSQCAAMTDCIRECIAASRASRLATSNPSVRRFYR